MNLILLHNTVPEQASYQPFTITKAKSKKMSVFWVTGLKILGRVGIHFFLIIFFFWKKINILCILKGIKLYIFFQKP